MTTEEAADLEIGIHRWDTGAYAAELRLNQPDTDADVRLIRNGPALFDIDFGELSAVAADPAAYGRALSRMILGVPAIQAAFAQARHAAQARNCALRLRLVMGPSVPELQALRWETLRDPADDAVLGTDENLLVSRYLTSSEWRPVRLRPRRDLQSLIVIAAPENLAEYRLAPIDVDAERSRALSNLGEMRSTVLAAPGQARLDMILDQLASGPDILYLVGHGALLQNEPWLFLEDEQGQVAQINGNELARGIRALAQPPRLLVLASCESAGSYEGAALNALGPRLAEAGVPAVLAMQGQISMETIAQCMPVFFRELQRDGRIDRALAVARGVVRDRDDWWMPVLYMRLKSGAIWYVPGFAEEDFEKWPALLRSIANGRCTPILGTGINEWLLGSSRDAARSWAENYGFPLAPHDRDDLPQVAQFLVVDQDENLLYDELQEHVRRQIERRFADQLDPALFKGDIQRLISAAGARRRREDPAEPHRALAELPFAVYITTGIDTLLAEALRDAGKDPQVELCRWNEDVEMLPSIYDGDPAFRPTPERPLVYHLFGTFDHPESLVLTEDDYFNYLIGVTSNRDLVPDVVRRALADTALLFLGFQIDAWDFRVIFRSVMNQEGGRRRRKYTHVAAQIDPEEGRILEPRKAQRYLERYFGFADISIFWGSSEDFIAELRRRMEAGTYVP